MSLIKKIPAIHLIELIIVWLSPFLISWYFIIFGILFYHLQMCLIGDCILTKIQFGEKNKKADYTYLLEKLGFKPDNKKVNFFVINIKPYIILFIAILLQIILKIKPLLF
jgi:hypothetical protein